MAGDVKTFMALLEIEKVYMDPSVDFATICRWLKADKEKLNSEVMAVFGKDGDEMIDVYRRTQATILSIKYGITL